MRRYTGTYPKERRIIHIMPSVHNTTTVINYAADNCELNGFLWAFDIWGCNGHFEVSDDQNYQEVWFEMSKEFLDISKTETMQRAFKNFGVRIMYYNKEKNCFESA